MTNKYAKMTNNEFQAILEKLVSRMSASEILSIGDVNSILSEELNNEVLDIWAAEHAEDEDEARWKELSRQEKVVKQAVADLKAELAEVPPTSGVHIAHLQVQLEEAEGDLASWTASRGDELDDLEALYGRCDEG